MYVCMYVCMYTCIHVCIYVCMYDCTYACMLRFYLYHFQLIQSAEPDTDTNTTIPTKCNYLIDYN